MRFPRHWHEFNRVNYSIILALFWKLRQFAEGIGFNGSFFERFLYSIKGPPSALDIGVEFLCQFLGVCKSVG